MPGKAKLRVAVEADTGQFAVEVQKATQKAKKFEEQTRRASAKSKTFSKSLRTAANSAAILNGPLDGTAGRLSALSVGFANFNPLLVTAGIGISTFTAGLFAATRAAAEYEVQIGRIEALIKSTGASAGLSGQDINALSEEIGRNTLASAKGIRDAAGILLTFRSITGDTFREALVLSQDLAAVMGSDAKNAALQLAKALEEPTTGLTALRRSGVSFTNSERDMIKEMVEAGRQLEAQRVILGKIHQQVGGAGSAEGQGLTGAIDLLGENWNKLLRIVGESSGSTSAATSFFNTMARGADRLINLISEDTVKKQQRLFQELLELKTSTGANPRAERARKLAIRAKEKELNDVLSLQRKQEQNELEIYTKSKEAQKQRDKEAAESREAARSKELEQIKAAQAAKNSALLEKTLSSQGLDSEAELARYNRLKNEMNTELEQLKEKELLTEEIKNEFRKRETLLTIQHQSKLKDIADKAESDRLDKQEKVVDFSISLFNRMTTAANDAEQKRKAVALAIGKVLLSEKKREGLNKAKIAGKVAIQEAWASAPFPANVPAVVLATAETAANISDIAGIAHGGLTNVPSESTYLLNRGERVLSPNQNKDFTDFMNSGGGTNVTVNLIENSSRAGEVSQNDNSIDIYVERIRGAMIDDVNRGRGLGDAIKSKYNLTTRAVA
jgi:Prophage tail length tape measure protein